MRKLLAAVIGALVLAALLPVTCVQGEFDEGRCTSALFITLPWNAQDADVWGVLTSVPAAILAILIVLKVRWPGRQD